MLNAIIIDDEKDALVTCQKKLEMYCPEVKVLATCLGAKAGLKAINSFNPNLVFLDIEMPWMNGFELLECLGEDLDFKVVFVTAYDQYAIRAFKVKAVDYLLKPISKDDLIECIEGVKQRAEVMSSEKLHEVISEVNKPEKTGRLLINTAGGIKIIKQEEIVYCEASSNYTYIILSDRSKVIASKTLSEITNKISPSLFFRTHKSYLVNLNFVKSYSNEDGGMLVIDTGETIPVSRRRKDEVLNAIAELE